MTRTIQADTDGNGTFNSHETVAISTNVSSVDTVSLFSDDWSLNSRVITTTITNGLLKVIQTCR